MASDLILTLIQLNVPTDSSIHLLNNSSLDSLWLQIYIISPATRSKLIYALSAPVSCIILLLLRWLLPILLHVKLSAPKYLSREPLGLIGSTRRYRSCGCLIAQGCVVPGPTPKVWKVFNRRSINTVIGAWTGSVLNWSHQLIHFSECRLYCLWVPCVHDLRMIWEAPSETPWFLSPRRSPRRIKSTRQVESFC